MQQNPNERRFDSVISFRNTRGEEARGSLLGVSRSNVTFEVYNPYSIVQLSEVLREVRIVRGERTLYSGNAVVSSLAATGVMLIVTATLVDAWQDLTGLAPGRGLREEVEQFVADFDSTHAVSPPYQLAVGNMADFLSELGRWLNQAETSVPAEGAVQREFLLEVDAGLETKLERLFLEFEEVAASTDPQQMIEHKTFARRSLHPVLMTVPFLHRCYTKPLGYAGDYEMVNMIVRDPLEGRNAYSKLINNTILKWNAAKAHRWRLEWLQGHLTRELQRAKRESRRLTVLNVGCGPAQELQALFADEPLVDQGDFTLMDFNEETLAYTRKRLTASAASSGNNPAVNYVHRSINELLKDATRAAAGKGEIRGIADRYDVVYCAGLFDYLSDKVCQRLIALFYSWNAPGGLVLATNVTPKNEARQFMEHVLEWNLIYRDDQDMAKLAVEGVEHVVELDPTGVNVFLSQRRIAEEAERSVLRNSAEGSS